MEEIKMIKADSDCSTTVNEEAELQELRSHSPVSRRPTTAASGSRSPDRTLKKKKPKKTNPALRNDKKSEALDAQAGRVKKPLALTEKGMASAKELGVEGVDLFVGLVSQIHIASHKGTFDDEVDEDFTLAFVKGGKPKDPIESALLTQAALTHQQLMRFANRLNNVESELGVRLYEPIFTRLARTFTSQVDALKRYRSQSESSITVHSVSVQDGGQAIVGHLTHQTRTATPQETGAPLAITDAKLMPMPSIGERQPERVPRVQLKKDD